MQIFRLANAFSCCCFFILEMKHKTTMYKKIRKAPFSLQQWVIVLAILNLQCENYSMESLLGAQVEQYHPDHLVFHRKLHQQKYHDETCLGDGTTCDKEITAHRSCWGYEDGCERKYMFSYPKCHRHHVSWAHDLDHQASIFWDQGDFGYVRKMKDQMIHICHQEHSEDSSLVCVTNDRFCHATNLFIDLTRHDFAGHDRYREDFFRPGEIGGHCRLDEIHKKQNGNKSPLQSWYAELQEYTSLDFHPIPDGKCDVTFEKPTFVFKLDSGINLYHHFCDFVNLYASQHLNGSFNTDVHIIMWDTSELNYNDLFTDTWRVFSQHPITRLSDYKGKRLCFRDVVFPLLARMIRGLYFNMPLVPYCSHSGLFRAFSEHICHRLGIQQEPYQEEVRITLISRKTKYRNIINEDELIGAMKRVKGIHVKAVHYHWREMSFVDQMRISHNSDIIIGMHGAGLTHTLFQPNWGALFELYNTEDANCYQDLANLRGTAYFTWQDKGKLFQEDEVSLFYIVKISDTIFLFIFYICEYFSRKCLAYLP